MKKCVFMVAGLLFLTNLSLAQYEEEEEGQQNGFKRENLFTGGSISLAFYSNTFLVGANPVLGWSVTKWLDAGMLVNYTYTSTRDISYPGSNDKIHQSVYGGGVFTKLYPIRFLFVQGQVEQNFIRQKYIPADGGGPTEKFKADATSYLVGGGYSTDRYPGSGRPFFYFSVLFDLSNEFYSPYKDAYGRTIPIFRAGIQVPLFQKQREE